MDSDGTHATNLAADNFNSPVCSPDGKFVYYFDVTGPHGIFRLPAEGSRPEQIATIPGEIVVGPLAISGNGKFLSIPYEQYQPSPSVHLAVIVIDGTPLATLDAPPDVYGINCLRWSPDDLALQYLVTRNGVTNIWQQPVRGGAPGPLTKFSSGTIFSFNWARGHRRLLLARGEFTRRMTLFTLGSK
jgi:hypothetical protein